MKKLFALLNLTAIYLCGISQSTTGNPGHYRHFNPAIKQYVKEHIMPVLLEKRQLVEKELTTAEKSDLVTYRTQLKQLAAQRKEQLQQKPTGVSMREFMQSDEQRAMAKQSRQQMKQIMQNVQAIANNHLATLDNIRSQLDPSLQQWKDDITKLRATANAQKANAQPVNTEIAATEDANTQSASTQNASAQNGNSKNWSAHRGGGPGMGYMMGSPRSYAHFLLMPAQPITASASDDLPGELESLMSEEPAASTTGGSLASFQLLPNPASNELVTGNEQLPGSNEFKLLDMQGRVALSLQNVQPAQHINVSQLPSGTYLAQLTSNGQSQQNKIVISH